MSKAQSPSTELTQSSPTSPPLDHILLSVRLTVAVENYVCDDHEDQATESAIELVLGALHSCGVNMPEIILLGSEFERLRVVQTCQ